MVRLHPVLLHCSRLSNVLRKTSPPMEDSSNLPDTHVHLFSTQILRKTCGKLAPETWMETPPSKTDSCQTDRARKDLCPPQDSRCPKGTNRGFPRSECPYLDALRPTRDSVRCTVLTVRSQSSTRHSSLDAGSFAPLL